MNKRNFVSPVGLVLLILGMVCGLSNVFIFRGHGLSNWLGLVFVISGIIVMRRAVEKRRKENVNK